MGRKRRAGPDNAGELPLEPLRIRLTPEERAKKNHALQMKIRTRGLIKAEKDESNRKFNTELDQHDEAIKHLAEELLMDNDLQRDLDVFTTTDEARRGLANVAAAAGRLAREEGHAFVEPAADKTTGGEAPRCAFPDCERFADEAVHIVAPHAFAGQGGAPCPCGEKTDSPCHQVGAAVEVETPPAEAPAAEPPAEPVDPEGTPAADPADDGSVFRKEPEPEAHAFVEGPLRRPDDKVPLCTDCERPEDDAVHREVDPTAQVADPAADEARA